jgi:hypothetical protein
MSAGGADAHRMLQSSLPACVRKSAIVLISAVK